MNRRNRRKDKKKDVPIKFKPSDITQDDIRNFAEVRKVAVKMSEFYEKYYKITLPNGEQVYPTLTDEERAIMDKAQELGVAPYVRIFRRKIGYKYEVHPEVEAALNCH